MKKIVYSFLALVFAFTGVNSASADKIIVPVVYHYGNTNYSQINVKNNSAEAVRVSVTFNGNITDSSGVTTNTSDATGKSRTILLAGNTTWTLLTKDTDLWSTTTSMKRNQVVVQTSADDTPGTIGMSATTGPVTVGALFVAADSSGNVSGFTFPAFYATRQWASVTAELGAFGGSYVDMWEQ
ncbi:MAG: hypothetical protein HZA01_09325 [Nitrospinae bacterium]|nr:hypothetical protein [Nitrospinota bacterium]